MLDMRAQICIVVNIVFTVLCMNWFELSLDSLRFFRLLGRWRPDTMTEVPYL